jgi:hypothetical protein
LLRILPSWLLAAPVNSGTRSLVADQRADGKNADS